MLKNALKNLFISAILHDELVHNNGLHEDN